MFVLVVLVPQTYANEFSGILKVLSCNEVVKLFSISVKDIFSLLIFIEYLSITLPFKKVILFVFSG